MNGRFLSGLVVSLAVVYVVLTVIGVMLGWQNGDLIYIIQQLPGITGLGVVGSVLAYRRPRNPIGWLFLSTPLALAAGNVCIGLAEYGTSTAPGSVPFAPIFAWLVAWFLSGFLLPLVFSLLLFPSGGLPSRSWRPVAVAVALIGLVVTLINAFGLRDFGPQHIANPFFVPALESVTSAANFYVLILLLAVAATSLVVRYRARSAVERQQLKWIVLGAVLLVAFLVVASAVPPLSGVASFLAFVVLPAGVAIGILRYQLYDIDHLINRTLVYGLTSGVIAVLFFAPVVGIQPLLRPLTSGSELAVAASTLVAFALFQPIRRRIQEAVDRSFDRSRYDSARTLDAFTEELRDEVDLDHVRADLIAAVRETMAPAHTSLWLREPHR